MLTPNDVANESTTITAINKALMVMLLKKNTYYQLEVINAGDTASAKIDAAQGTVQAKMLNALMKLVQSAGNTNISIRGDEDALHYSTSEQVLEATNEIFFVLYNWNAYLDPEQGSSIGVIPSAGVFGDWASVGQRCLTMLVCNCGCTPCSCKFSATGRKKPLHWLDVC